jgi:hypothetical protein
MPPGNHLQHHVICIQISVSALSFIYAQHIFATPVSNCHSSARAVWTAISRSSDSDIHNDFIYLTYHTSLLLSAFISFRIIAIQLNDGHSKMAIEFDR